MLLRFLFIFNWARLIHENEWLSSDNIELFTDSTGLRVWCILSGSLDILVMAVFRVSANTSGNLFVGKMFCE